MKNPNPFENVVVSTEEVEGDLVPLEFDPRDREKLGLPDENPLPVPGNEGVPVAEEVFVTSETAVRAMIKTLFFAGYMFHGEGHEHWLKNEEAIEEIVPGMTRFVNQYPSLARAIEFGDTVAAPIKLLIVAVKNQLQSIQIKRAEMKGTVADSSAPKKADGENSIYGGGLYDGIVPKT